MPLEVDVHAKRKLRSGRVVADSILLNFLIVVVLVVAVEGWPRRPK